MLQVWNISEIYQGPKTLTGHDGIVLAICTAGYVCIYSYSSNIIAVIVYLSIRGYLYSGGSDNTIKVWDIQALKLSSTLPAHDDPVCSLTVSSSRLFSGSLKSIKVCWLHDYQMLIQSCTLGIIGMDLVKLRISENSSNPKSLG